MQTTKPAYDRKEEILNDGKRYRKYNNYLTIGGGYLSSSSRSATQKSINLDFQFHIKRQHFQAGLMMSGDNFTGNNNSEAHFGYGLRREKASSNVAVFLGPTFFTGVQTLVDSLKIIRPRFYQGVGGYACLQAVKKITYDIGIGAELFLELSQEQRLVGVKFILFFSGAYRGVKKNYNPNVRSENNR